MKQLLTSLLCPLLWTVPSQAQQASLFGTALANGQGLPYVNLLLSVDRKGTSTDENGRYTLEGIPPGTHRLWVTSLGYAPRELSVVLRPGEDKNLDIELVPLAESLEGIVVSGTLKPVSRLESPVPVEVYSPAFLKKNPTPSIFEALQQVNGVRPQINCNVCNTGDIHINGLEGPYTLVLIDGMPIVSGLGTVYGLMGIPNSLIEQIEIVKGPASTLYGSEAVGGLINIITKNAVGAPHFSADALVSGWGEYNLDLGGKISWGEGADLLLGANYFNYDVPVDHNGDNFTDLTLQQRISVFQKWNFPSRDARPFTLAGRFFYEDRWGGEMQWTPAHRGGDQVYGESIHTRRWEVLGNYPLPLKEKLLLSLSYNDHAQNSVYGNTAYLANQRIGFAQLAWDKALGRHDLLVGSAFRYNFYDDNTPATPQGDAVWIPSLFVQDEYRLSESHSLLGGLRYDHDPRHGNILSPRLAHRWKLAQHDILRLNAGTGFRVVNLFTEEHAALTGAREVLITEQLKPERSVNVNLNYLKKIYNDSGTFIAMDVSLFYTHFSNIILPDYDTDPNLIIYDNLDGKSISQGISANIDLAFAQGPKVMVGATWQDVRNTENGLSQRQILTESFSATWSLSQTIRAWDLTVDLTGNLYGPMRLPLLGELDPRSPMSPIWGIQNIQFTYTGFKNFELYGGIKNLFDWTPDRGTPFLIARAHDPFDKNVDFDADQQVVATPENPYALTFDPSYVYGPNQGIRGFLGLRYTLFE